jgi:lipopolysaccharide assembly outer membrane protein LptD (OstA)
MKSLFATLALLLISIAGAFAQLDGFSDVPIEINAEDTRIEGGTAIAEGNVVIRYDTILIYCDYAQYSPDTRDVLVQGNVRLYREGQLFTGERALYNLETKRLNAADFRGEFIPFRFAGDTLSSLGGNAYLVKDGIFTTSDNSKPDYHIKAKTVRIYPNDRIIFSNVTLYIGRTPIFWFPYVYQSLNKDQGFSITPGYTSKWGAYLLGQYTFPLGEGWSAKLRLDLLADRGIGGGLESDWATGKLTEGKTQDWGRFRFYGIDDKSADTNKTGNAREEIDSGRYRVSLQARQYITENIYASVDINKLSDARFLEDYAEGEFRRNPNPDNAVSLTYWNEDFTGTLLYRQNWNDDSFDGTERLPEGYLDIKRQQVFRTPIFYEGETSAGFLRRNFADDSQFQDYDTFRADTFHQFTLPFVVKNVLSIVPRVGVRGTYYSDTGTFEDREVTETVEESVFNSATGLTETTRRQVTRTERLLREEGSLFRPVFNAGIEMSFKFSKAFEQVQSRAWGLDGLRHVVQPWLNLGYTYSGEDPAEILQIDRLNRSTQLPPVDYPQFNSIDSIDTGTILRLGVRQRWQTRRDNQTINWLEWNTFFDAYLDRPEYGLTMLADGGNFSNVYNRLRWTPLPWLAFDLDSQLPILDEGFTEVNSRLGFLVTDYLRISLGHRYINGNPLFLESNLIDFGTYVRLGDHWAFSFRESYEFETSTLESQRYELHRDLSSWVASLGFYVRDNRGSDDYGVLLTFTLKDLPNVRLPLSLDPDSSGGGGGKSR